MVKFSRLGVGACGLLWDLTKYPHGHSESWSYTMSHIDRREDDNLGLLVPGGGIDPSFLWSVSYGRKVCLRVDPPSRP